MMSDDLKQQVEQLNKVQKQLQQGLYALQTEKQVLNQTLGGIMTENVQLRTALIMMENQCKDAEKQAAAKDVTIEDLNKRLAVANAVITSTTNLTPAPLPENNTENPAPQE
jgi:chromosome segregation ATPase